MNSSSTIEISKSSLLSLKAEVLRKQQEINKAKLQTRLQQTQTPLRHKSKNSTPQENEVRNRGIDDRSARDEAEDIDMLAKSKKMLESKARLYDRLVKGPSKLTQDEIEMNKHYLVQFDRKSPNRTKDSSDEEHFSDEYEPANNEDDEWVEYVDCLGRTRKCLRKDLDYLKNKDYELSKSLGPDGKRIQTDTPKWTIDTEGDKPTETNEEPSPETSGTITENNEMLSSDMRRELLRQEWEKQEQELMNKRDVHYQDVLFNEARSHGVGYYAFSKDEDIRAKQQEELRKLREETKQNQKSSLEQKALREQQLAARLKAARNRKRARMGLPPEEDEPAKETPPELPVEENEEEKKIAAAKEAEEKAKEEARKRQIRPWDIGKEGIKKHYEYSQEEWVDKKRGERPKEFAPPQEYRGGTKKQTSEATVAPETRRRQFNETQDREISEPDKSLFFTTKKTKKNDWRDCESTSEKSEFWVDTTIPPPNFAPKTYTSINPYKTHSETFEPDIYTNSSTFEPTPIVDECVDFDEEQERQENLFEKRSVRGIGAEIAPPPTFDYYGPSSTKTKNTTTKQSIEDSVAAGLRFLREQAEKKEKSAERRNLDYT